MVITHEVDNAAYLIENDYTDNLGENWSEILKETLQSDYMSKLMFLIDQTYLSGEVVYPIKQKDLFKAFKYTDFDDVKVVIIGKEPSHELSNGLAFGSYGVANDPIKCPKLSLIKENLSKSIKYDKNTVFDKSLLSVAQQGVLMLNATLLGCKNFENKYNLYFREFTRQVLHSLSEQKAGIIFAFTDTDLYNRFKHCIDESFHYILNYPMIDANCTIFKDINDVLENQREEPILW